jgi:hypothetical protein
LNQNQQPNNAVATRSRWQNLVIEAGVTAGGIGAAVSEESMKSLKYCLHWLHYATAHLDHQVGILRDFILSFSSVHRHDSLIRSTEDSRAAEILNGIKRDVVETIRKVVDVVSTYAGSALPEQAKRYVRSSILGLPERWTRAMQELPPAEGSEQGAAATAQQSSNGQSQPQPQPMGPTQAAAERTLTFEPMRECRAFIKRTGKTDASASFVILEQLGRASAGCRPSAAASAFAARPPRPQRDRHFCTTGQRAIPRDRLFLSGLIRHILIAQPEHFFVAELFGHFDAHHEWRRCKAARWRRGG